MNPAYGMEKRFKFLQQKHPILKCNLLHYPKARTQLSSLFDFKRKKVQILYASLLSIKLKYLNANTKHMKQKGSHLNHALKG
jgi:hypothetical protein